MIQIAKCISILSFLISCMIHISCICFVGWKTAECFMKFFDNPQGTKLDVKNLATVGKFPSMTIGARNEGLRWNVSHLNYCGIQE